MQCGTPVPGGEPQSPTLTPQGREIFDRLQNVIEGRYELQRELGRGGMAVVFLGYQMSLARHVAIKVLLPILSYDAALVQRFMREARTQGKLDHPNIIPVYEVYNEGGLTFFTMPYFEGGSLRKLLVERPQLPLETALRYLHQAADALGYAHRRGVVHRDVKPDNMLVDAERDRIIITDFGIAKAVAMESTLTTPGDLLGTPQYMSPEQGEGRTDLDGRADQYSLGLIGYEMLAGRRPFQADNLAELMYKHRFEEPDLLDLVCPDIPRPVCEVITRSIHKEREQRYANMEEFKAALPAPALAATDPTPTPPAGEAPTVRVVTPQRGRVEDVEVSKPSASIPEWLVETTPERVVLPKRVPPKAAPARRPVAPARQPAKRGRRLLWAVPVLLLAGAVYLGGPWSPLRAPADVSSGAALEPLEEVGPPFGGTVVTEGEPGEEAGPLAAGEQTPSETPGPAEGAPGPETAGPEAAGTEAPAAAAGAEEAETEPAAEAEPPRTPIVPAVTRTQAEQARAEADRARQAALDAGAQQVAASGLSTLDRRRSAAMVDMAGGRFAAAREALGSLALDYRRLERNVWKTKAEGARTAALRAQQAARGEGGESLTHADLDRLGRSAEQAFAAERYSQAQPQFLSLAAGYEALTARDGMRRQRAAAEAVGAQQEEPGRLASADQVNQRGEAQFQRAAYGDARPLFERAASLYSGLAAELAKRASERPAEVAPAEERPEPPSAPSAEEVVNELVERFRVNFEQEDLGRMGSELYRGPVPAGDARHDGNLMRAVFARTEELRVEIRERSVRVDGPRATADLRLKLSFRQARTGAPADWNIDLRLSFASAADGWRLQQVERR